MSSAEQQTISVCVDHNPYLAEGAGTVEAIVSTNGITLNDNEQFLPKSEETPLSERDRIHVGASTTITLGR